MSIRGPDLWKPGDPIEGAGSRSSAKKARREELHATWKAGKRSGMEAMQERFEAFKEESLARAETFLAWARVVHGSEVY